MPSRRAIALGAVAVVTVALLVGTAVVAGRHGDRAKLTVTGPAGQPSGQQPAAADEGSAASVPHGDPAAADPELRTRSGRVVARADRTTIEEVPLSAPATVEVRGEQRITDSVYRITISAGPFAVRDAPVIVSLGGQPLCIASETTDLASVVCFTFDQAVVTQGSTMTLAHGLPGQARTEWTGTIEVTG